MHGPWKRTLALVSGSQFLSIAAFGFGLPFAPFYLQELGAVDPTQLKIWIALFAGATPLTIALAAPFWGRMADRHGRRLMLVRANLGGALVLCLMGWAATPAQLVMLRLMQGVLTGTVSAAQAMVAGASPDNRHGQALGWLSAAVYSGVMAGAALGGWSAQLIGFRSSFFLSGLLLAGSAALIWFGVTESAADRTAPATPPGPAAPRNGGGWRNAAPWMAGLMAIAFMRQMDSPFLPLRVQDILGGMENAAGWTGALNAVGGLAGLAAGLLLAPWADRTSPARMLRIAGGIAALAAAGQAAASGLAGLLAARFALVFCAGALEPALQAWLARGTPRHERGAMFGWASSVRSIGWFASAAAGGSIASAFEVRGLLAATAAGYLLLALWLPATLRRTVPAAGE